MEYQTPDPEWLCFRCLQPKSAHKLVNWADPPHVGEAALICPTVIYEPLPREKKEN